jgi:hypothetical protein
MLTTATHLNPHLKIYCTPAYNAPKQQKLHITGIYANIAGIRCVKINGISINPYII